MSSGIRRSVRGFSDTCVLERILFALDQRFEIERGAVAVVECVGTQTVERRLRQIAKPANVRFLRVRQAGTILAEDGLNAPFDLGVPFGRKLGEVGGLRRDLGRQMGEGPAES